MQPSREWRRAVDVVFRALPVVVVADYFALLEAFMYRGDRVR